MLGNTPNLFRHNIIKYFVIKLKSPEASGKLDSRCQKL